MIFFNGLGKFLAVALVAATCMFQYTGANAADTLIMDNGGAGTSSTGTWKVSSGPAPYGSNSFYASNNGASYTYLFNLDQPGKYQVYARWTETSLRRTSVPYDIYHLDGKGTVTVNQRQNGGQWQKLGDAWSFGDSATISIRSLGSGSTSADAIKLVYVGDNTAGGDTTASSLPIANAADTLIMDNGGAGTSSTGTWKVSSGPAPYGSNSFYASNNGASYTYLFNLDQPGKYQVYARWTETSLRRTSVPYDIYHLDGKGTVTVNQRQNGGQWQKLGDAWSFGDSATISIRSLGSGSTSADAIKLVYVGDNTAGGDTTASSLPIANAADTLIMDNGGAGTSSTGTWKVSSGPAPYGSNSFYASNNGASYTYLFNLDQPGKYQVYARWTETSLRRTSVPYDIYHLDGKGTVTVNQRQNGGQWQKLGDAWSFGDSATISIRSLGSGSTSADAIKLVYVGDNTAGGDTTASSLPIANAADTLIMDNGGAGTSSTGTWTVSSGPAPYGSNSFYASNNGASYTYLFNLDQPGKYQVYARWTETSLRRTSVPYDIYHLDGKGTVTVNQRQNGGQWQKLGDAWSFGDSATISIRSLGSGSTSADAIKLVYVGGNTTSGSTTSLSLSWTAPVARADGTGLSLSEIAGYTVYYGKSAGNYSSSISVNDGSATSATISNLTPGSYYMVMTTRDYGGRESVQSSMVAKQVP